MVASVSKVLDKAVADWKSAKTDKKRASSAAKLLHVLGLVGCDLDMKDRDIARNLRPRSRLPATGQAFNSARRSHAPIRVR